jgi:hypothetical protein
MASHLLKHDTNLKSMKLLLLIGALVGFLTGVVLGLANQSGWPMILWRSAFASLAFGILLRWWGQRWVQCLRTAQQERFAALMAQRKDSKNPSTSKS